jgi:hypothetical protein
LKNQNAYQLVELGAVINGGEFKVPEDPLEPFRYQEQMEE